MRLLVDASSFCDVWAVRRSGSRMRRAKLPGAHSDGNSRTADRGERDDGSATSRGAVMLASSRALRWRGALPASHAL
jgi:hypothetical protein